MSSHLQLLAVFIALDDAEGHRDAGRQDHELISVAAPNLSFSKQKELHQPYSGSRPWTQRLSKALKGSKSAEVPSRRADPASRCSRGTHHLN